MYCLLNAPYIRWLDSLTYGTKMPRVNPEQVGSSRAPVPPEPEQHAIAAFLDRETARIDGLVARKERLVELLQEKRTALITRAVTRGLDPNVPMKDSGVEWLGKIPAHWEVKRTKFAATLRSGHTPSRQNPEYWKDCTIPWFGLADVWQIRDGQVEYVHVTAALLHGSEQIADLPVPVAESPGAVRIGHPERGHLVEYLAPNSVFNSLPRQRSSPHLRPDDRLVTIDRVFHHASLGAA